jgi:hypothetical protein
MLGLLQKESKFLKSFSSNGCLKKIISLSKYNENAFFIDAKDLMYQTGEGHT